MNQSKEKTTLLDIELATALYFDFNRNLVIPNIRHSLCFYEMDLLIVTTSGYAYEVEIKTSKADLIRDKKKSHSHNSHKIRKLFFAVPFDLVDSAKSHCPERAGLLACHHSQYSELIRPAKLNHDAKPLSQEKIRHLHDICSRRVWSLKNKLNWLIKDRYSYKAVSEAGKRGNPKKGK